MYLFIIIMKSIKNFLLFISLFFFNILFVYSENIAFLDINYILNNSLEYKKYINNLNNKFKKYLILVNKYKNNLINEENNLNKNKYFINYKKFKLLKINIIYKKNKIYKNINNIQIYLNKENFKIHKIFLLKIIKIIKDLSKIKKYDIVLNSNSIFYYNNHYIHNITNYVINKINNNKLIN